MLNNLVVVAGGLDRHVWVPEFVLDVEGLREVLWRWHESGGEIDTESARWRKWTQWLGDEDVRHVIGVLAGRLDADRISELTLPTYQGDVVSERGWVLVRPYSPPRTQVDGVDPIDHRAWMELLIHVAPEGEWVYAIRRSNGNPVDELFAVETWVKRASSLYPAKLAAMTTEPRDSIVLRPRR